MYIYSDPELENDPHALPDIEIFHNPDDYPLIDEEPYVVGWYWWYCMPGYLPDGEPSGPFDTEELAIADAMAANQTSD